MDSVLCVYLVVLFAIVNPIEQCHGNPSKFDEIEDNSNEDYLNGAFEDGFEQAEDSGMQKIHAQFEDFIKKHNKVYLSTHEKEKRLKIFAENLEYYEKMNGADMGTATYGVDQFSDMTVEEFREKMLTFDPSEFKSRVTTVFDGLKLDRKKAPKNFSWLKKGKVTPVKNQGRCGSCWAFSAVANLESLYAIKHNELELLSEQQLVDCTTTCHGCNGGWMSLAIEYVKDAGGIEKDVDYPYTAKTEVCAFNKTLVVFKVKENVMLPNDEAQMVEYLYLHGPISVALDGMGMRGYKSGIAYPREIDCSKNATAVNHGVTAVGYGVQKVSLGKKKKRLPFWIIKNSWSTHFGQEGYYFLYRGDNSCGINSYPSSAVLA